MWTGGEGVKKSQNFVDVIFGWPLRELTEVVALQRRPRSEPIVEEERTGRGRAVSLPQTRVDRALGAE